LGNSVEEKIARLKINLSIETEQFRQAKYLNWCQIKKIPYVCGNKYGYKHILACFIENLIIDCHSCSATAFGYVQAINKLFELRNCPIPADLSDNSNMLSQIIQACECEESIARQWSPLTKEMYIEMAKHAKASSQDSVHSVLFDFFNLIIVGGFRVSEYTQKTQTKVDQFDYALGNKVVKAFIPSDWQFYNASGCLMMIHSLNGLAKVPKWLRITFRIQKSRKNGQKITFTADDKHPRIFPVRSAYQIFLRAKRLGQSDDQPMGVFLNHQGILKYLTGNKISELLQSIAKHCHPDLTKDEISRFFSHSGRFWAVVLLDEAGMTSDFIKSWLRWMGDSYRLYLRDTLVLQAKHVTALEQASFDFISLYGENCTTLPDIVPEDDSMRLF
jgi:hypothetical protein